MRWVIRTLGVTAGLQRALRRRNPLHAIRRSRRRPQGPSQRLVDRLDAVMIVATAQQVDLTIDASMVGHGENDNSYGRSRSVLRGYSVQGDGQPPIRNINCNSSY